MIDFKSQDWLQYFKALSVLEQVTKLAEIIHHVTMIGRSTYDAESNGVANPERLRGINEVAQRLSSLQLGIALGNERNLDSFVNGTFDMLEGAFDRLCISKGFLEGRSGG